MTQCQCWQCSPNPPPTYTREYMLECRARGLLKQPKALRRIFVAEVWKARGEETALELIAEIVRLGGIDAIEMRPDTRLKIEQRRQAA